MYDNVACQFDAFFYIGKVPWQPKQTRGRSDNKERPGSFDLYKIQGFLSETGLLALLQGYATPHIVIQFAMQCPNDGPQSRTSRRIDELDALLD
jgi:hypothetical protein